MTPYHNFQKGDRVTYYYDGGAEYLRGNQGTVREARPYYVLIDWDEGHHDDLDSSFEYSYKVVRLVEPAPAPPSLTINIRNIKIVVDPSDHEVTVEEGVLTLTDPEGNRVLWLTV